MNQHLQRGQFRRTRLSRWNQLGRVLWQVVYVMLFRPSPRTCHTWRRLLLRLFGARIGRGVRVCPSVRVFAPWNVELDNFSSLGDSVDCYSVGRIYVGKYTTVSQYSVLCTASHDHSHINLPLIVGEIHIGAYAWVCADVFVMPDVQIGEGAVVGARSTVTRDVEPWKIAVGSPSKVVGPRVLKQDDAEGIARPTALHHQTDPEPGT